MCYGAAMGKMIQPRADDQPADPPDDWGYDPLSGEDIAQAEAGTLFSIQGERFQNVQWSIHRYRTRAEMASDPSGEKTEWVLDVVGELNGTDLVGQIGGGTFRFYGYVERTDSKARRLAYNRLISLAGPRKNFAAVPPPPMPAVTPNGLSRGERLMLKLLRNQDARLQQLERAPAVAPVAGPSLKDIAETMVMLQSLTPKGPASDSSVAKELFSTMMAATKTGIELGQAREPLPAEEVNTTVKVLEAVGPLATRFLDILSTRRVPPTAPRRAATPPPAAAGATSPPPAAQASAAEVVGEEEPPPVAMARMMVVMDVLAAGFSEHADLEDIADTMDRILPPGEIAGLLALPEQAVVQDIATRAGGQYPELNTDEGRSYLLSVLTELRRVPDDLDTEI